MSCVCANKKIYRLILLIIRTVNYGLLFLLLVGIGLACAPVRCAHPSFWVHCHAKRGAARPPRPSQLRCFLFDPQIYLQSIELGRPRQGFFSFHWTTEAMKYEVPCPLPPVKLCINATVSPHIFGFFLFSIDFGSFLFAILFFFFSPFQFLLILLFLSFSSYLFLLISSYSSRRCYSSSSYSSILIHLGSKFMYIPVRPNYFCYILFY
jgi:hypothetical protein